MNKNLSCLATIGVVVIGRNEGERLKRCLRSIPDGLPVVYVDSGSSDESVQFARSIGVTVVELDNDFGFTAARARNAGWRDLVSKINDLEFIQFVDGDCELDANWMSRGLEAMRHEADLAAVFGRRRERFPGKSIYNKMCDDEWDTPLGIVGSCGGDVFFRAAALMEVGGYSDDLIAGEEPDLCLRLRKSDWRIRRIDFEMTLHDADILEFGSWWKRSERGGFAYAEHVWRHRSQSDPHRVRQLASIAFWSVCVPLISVIVIVWCAKWGGLAIITATTIFLGVYALQIARIALRKMRSGSGFLYAVIFGSIVMFSKFAEFSGATRCFLDNLFGRNKELIEYKNQDKCDDQFKDYRPH